MLSASLNNIKFRNKLLLLLVFPLLALLYFSTANIVEKWQRFQTARTARSLIHISQNLVETLNHYEKEGRLSTAYFEQTEINIEAALKKQHAKTDKAIEHLTSQYPSLTVAPKTSVGLITSASLGKLFEKRLPIRAQVALLKNRRDSLAYYSKVNAEILYLVEGMTREIKKPELLNKGRAYSQLLWLQEYAVLERDLFNRIINSETLNPDLLEEVQGYIAKQNGLLADLKHLHFSEDHPAQISTFFTETEASALEQIRTLSRRKLEKLDRLNTLQALIGYGGMIHHFKNYLLRNRAHYRERFHEALVESSKIIRWYQSSPALSNEASQALRVVSAMLESYKSAIITVEKLHRSGVTITEIDRQVVVDDQPALAALDLLQKNFGKIDQNTWFESATKRINHFKSLSEQLGTDMIQIAEQEMNAARMALLVYIAVTIAVLLLSLILGWMISKHLLSGINLILNTLRHAEETGDFRGTTEICGSDEVAQIAASLNTLMRGRLVIEEKLILAAKVFDHTVEGIVITDPHEKIIAVNPAVTKMTGYSEKELIGKTPRMLQSGRHDHHFYEEMWKALHSKGYWQGEIWNKKKNGEIYPEWQNIGVVRDYEGNIINYIAVFSDMTTRKEYEELLHSQAYYDPLTRLPNRTLFFEHLSQSLKQLKRSQFKTALLFVDLDAFKQVNDTFGHQAGDRILKETAKRLLDTVRETDTVARLGGDEFVIILPESIERKTVSIVADKIIEQLSAPFVVGQNEVILGASIGITIAPDDGNEKERLLQNADMAMYQSKLSGKNTCRFYSEKMRKREKGRALLDWDLRRAVDKNELTLYYQPLIDLRTRKTTAIEALVRWQHPEKGLLLPEFFIDLAEESDLIKEIGTWILESACTQVKYWQDRYNYGGSLNVNISSRQIAFGDFRSVLTKALETSRLAPEHLTLEIQENLILGNKKEVIHQLNELKSEGEDIALDDFGTGTSSLYSLSEYPIDHLKIDISFVHDVVSSRSRQSLVEAMIRMGQSLNMKVIAEGIETETDLNFVSALGCDIGQGFYFAHPLSAEDYEAVLKGREGKGREGKGREAP